MITTYALLGKKKNYLKNYHPDPLVSTALVSKSKKKEEQIWDAISVSIRTTAIGPIEAVMAFHKIILAMLTDISHRMKPTFLVIANRYRQYHIIQVIKHELDVNST